MKKKAAKGEALKSAAAQVDSAVMPLLPLDEFNRQKRDEHFMRHYEPQPNGIACPACGHELVDSNPCVVLTSYPPQKTVSCPACKYSGYRVA